MKPRDTKFKQLPGHTNELLCLTEDSWVSFNAMIKPPLGLSICASDDHQPETALRVDGKWYVLNGDFRAEVETAAADSINAIVAVFAKHMPKHESTWSTPLNPKTVLEWFKKRLENYP